MTSFQFLALYFLGLAILLGQGLILSMPKDDQENKEIPKKLITQLVFFVFAVVVSLIFMALSVLL